jgi:predicted acylesterase/phospholipase RssA
MLRLTRSGITGTSIGALVGGLYAREGDLITSSARAKQFSGRMGNIWRLLSDMTYPIVAYTTVSLLESRDRRFSDLVD